jgi:6-phosphogluconolactonase (cycloisomerase 2 family)
LPLGHAIGYGKKPVTYLFVGTYTEGKPDKGIYVYELNPLTGYLRKISSGKNITNPSFLTLSPDGNYLYACTDTKLPNEGSISSFHIDSNNGKLSFINKQPCGGSNPVYVTTHANCRYIIAGNYDKGSVAVFTANTDGTLNPYTQLIHFTGRGVNLTRQENAHVHAVVFSPDNNYVYLPDLGSDKIWALGFDSTRREPLSLMEGHTIKTFAGSGPRHLLFHSSNKFAYCIEELAGYVSAYSYSNGKLALIQRIFSYAKKHNSYSGADIHTSPDGRFLYASNRGDEENTLSIFSITQTNGTLKLVGQQDTYGEHPRNFIIDPTGKFLLVANQKSNNIVVFRRDPKTGLLRKTNTVINVPRPSCLQLRTYGN